MRETVFCHTFSSPCIHIIRLRILSSSISHIKSEKRRIRKTSICREAGVTIDRKSVEKNPVITLSPASTALVNALGAMVLCRNKVQFRLSSSTKSVHIYIFPKQDRSFEGEKGCRGVPSHPDHKSLLPTLGRQSHHKGQYLFSPFHGLCILGGQCFCASEARN